MLPKRLTQTIVNQAIADGIVTAHAIACENAPRLQAFANKSPDMFALVKTILLIDLGYSSTDEALKRTIAELYGPTITERLAEAKRLAIRILEADALSTTGG